MDFPVRCARTRARTRTFLYVPAKEPKREFKGGDKIRVNLHPRENRGCRRSRRDSTQRWTQATGDETAKAAKRTPKNGKSFHILPGGTGTLGLEKN